MQLTSTEYWYHRAILGDESVSDKDIVSALAREVPNMVSVTFERTCNLQCAHCVYQPERSSKRASHEAELGRIVGSLVAQLKPSDKNPFGDPPRLLHEGRIILPWHIEVLAHAKSANPALEVGLIDNGTYVKHLDVFARQSFELSWIDISVDGTEATHNRQRDPIRERSFQDAMRGLKHAREVTIPREEGGRVSSLFTLTSLNYRDIRAVADMLYSEDLVDTFGVTTLSPARPSIREIELSPNYASGDIADFAVAWEQVQSVAAMCPTFYLAIYRHQDLEKLARVVGPRTFLEALKTPLVNKDELTFSVDGVSVKYAPLSTWPKETFLLDADGVNRLAYSLKYTIDELRSGTGADGSDTRSYSMDAVDSHTCISKRYADEIVPLWWERFGRSFLSQEIEMVERLECLR